MEEINSSFFTEFQKVFTFIFMSSWHRKESNCRDKSYNLKGAWLQRQLLLDLQALEHFPNSPRIILWPWSQITTNTQISPMQELEAISVLGRKLYFAASWRCPDTRAAALTKTTWHHHNPGFSFFILSFLFYIKSNIPQLQQHRTVRKAGARGFYLP